ncbi:MAG: MnhB domain-containing protein [Acidilobaceae archaeon]
MDFSTIVLLVGTLAALGSTVACVYLIEERDLLKAAIASGLVSLFYCILFLVLMAPSILLVYVLVSVVLVTVLLVILVVKTERYEATSAERFHKSLIKIALMFVTIIAGSYLALNGGWFGESLPPRSLRKIAETIVDNLISSATLSSNYLAARSPDAVAAVVWDYRGIDTFFESTILYLATMATTFILLREVLSQKEELERVPIASPIAVTVAKLLYLVLIPALAVALTSHPGGGFPGGALITSVIVIFLIASRFGLSTSRLEKRILTLIALVCCGTLALSLISTFPIVLGFFMRSPAFLLQNQPKAVSPVGFISELLGEPIGGSIFFLEASESLLVSAGLTLVLILLLYSSRPKRHMEELKVESLE